MSDNSNFDSNDVGKVAAIAIGGAAFGAISFLAAKSGIFQSTEARKERNSEESPLVAAPRPGTPLLVSIGTIAEHSGIYLGRSHVAEFNGNGMLCDSTLTDFINGRPDDTTNLRRGTRIFAACDKETRKPLSSLRVAATARNFLTSLEKLDYNLFGKNCHFFTASCIYGKMLDDSGLGSWLRRGTFSIDILGNMISNTLNAGREIAWLGVRGPSRLFNYSLTESKILRLKREGKI